MKTKHSKGRWVPQIGTFETCIRGKDNIVICEINNLTLPKEFEANAKLISAAPEMLIELESTKRELNLIVDMLVNGETCSDSYVNNLVNNIDVVIQKATS